jgi:fibronectin type 3 domain-containing protein
MKKMLRKVPVLLISILLTYQILLPAVNVYAAYTDNSILPPSNLTHQFITPDDVKLSWSSVFDAKGYNIYSITEGQLKQIATTTNTNYTFNNLVEGDYTYVVSTISSLGESGPGAPITITVDYPIMETPTNLSSIIKNGNDIVLSWDVVTYADSYNIYSITEDGEKNLISSTANKTYTISNVVEGNYKYVVAAKNSLYGESMPTNSIDIGIKFPTISEPKNVSYTITNGTDINIKWDVVSYATAYNVYLISNGEKILKGTAATNNFKLVNYPAGDYNFEIYSFSSRFGESSLGAEVYPTVSNIEMLPPANLTSKLQNVNDIVLSWSTATNATSYKIYQIIDGERILKSNVTGTSITYTNFPSGDYTFEVTSNNTRFGESLEASQVNMSVGTVEMIKPENLNYIIKNGNDVVLSWEAVPYATNYRIYQIINGQKVYKSLVTGTSGTYTNLPGGIYSYVIHSYSSKFGESSEGSQVDVSIIHPKMEAPGNAIQTIKTATDFSISWDPVPYATSYKVYQIVDGNKILKKTTTTLNTSFIGMLPGEYTYEIYSYSTRFGESEFGSQVDVVLNGEVMLSPDNLTYSYSNINDVTLSWSAVPYATSYKIYEVIDGIKLLKTTITSTSIKYTNIRGGNYNYVVHSVSKLLGESSEGSEVSFSLVLPEMQQPLNLTSKVQNGNDVVLNWTSVQYANKYNVYEIIDGELVLKGSPTGVTFTMANQSEGPHTYVVHSFSTRFGESVIGSDSEVSIEFPEMLPPESLSYTILNGNDINLKWTASSYANYYNIYKVVDGQRILLRTVTGAYTTTFLNMPSGNYEIQVTANSSRYGESLQGISLNFNLGQVIMNQPNDLTSSVSNGNDITLRWSAATYATSYKIYKIINGVKTLLRDVAPTSTALLNMPEGKNDFIVHSYSTRFGESPAGSEISVDLSYPVVQKPQNQSFTITNGNDLTLKWTAPLYANSYNIYRFINGEKQFIKNVTTLSSVFTNMPEGEYTYHVNAVSNRFGESLESAEINVEIIWPVVQSPILSSSIFNANNITLTWNSVEWANEYKVYKLKNGGMELLYKGNALSYKVYNLTEDTHDFQVVAYSTRFGESNLSNIVTENIIYPVMQPPVANIKLIDQTSAILTWNFVTYSNSYNIYEIIDGKKILVAEKINNLSYTIKDLTYNNHEYIVTSYSNSFGESKESNIVLVKLITDIEAPVTVANEISNWTNIPQLIALSASDNETGVEKIYYSLNSGDFVIGDSIEVITEGLNKISFYSIDKAGNKEVVKTITAKIDYQAPVSYIEKNDIWNQNEVTLKIDNTDNLSGVHKTYYSINGSEFTSGNEIHITQDGTYSIEYYSIDNAGNIESIKSTDVKIDAKAPETSVEAPEGWVNKDVTLEFKASDLTSGINMTYYSVNGSDFIQGSILELRNEGIYNVNYYSIDIAENKEKVKTVTVKIDKSSPETKVDMLDKWYSENVAIDASANDNLSGLYKTYYSLDGFIFKELENLIIENEGIHTVYYFSIDNAGNRESTQTKLVKIDKTAPVIELEISNQVKLGSTINSSLNVFDYLSEITNESITLETPKGSVSLTKNELNHYPLNDPGKYVIKVTATNGAGLVTSIEKAFSVYIPATIIITPITFTNNKGVVTARIELPDGFSTENLDLNSAKLNGVPALSSNKGYYNQAANGQFKFERSSFKFSPPEVSVEFICSYNDVLVIAKTTLKVNK